MSQQEIEVAVEGGREAYLEAESLGWRRGRGSQEIEWDNVGLGHSVSGNFGCRRFW